MNDLQMMFQDPTTQDGSVQGLITVIGIFVISVWSIVLMGGLLLLVAAMAPNITHRAGYCLRTRSFLSFLAGLGGMGALLLGGAVGHHAPPLAVVVLALMTVGCVLALGATSEVLGRKMAILAGRDGSRISHLIWGWLAYSLASGVPFVGWFVILPYGLIAGLGATILGFFVREEV